MKRIMFAGSVRSAGAAMAVIVVLGLAALPASPAAATQSTVTIAAPVRLAAGDRHTCAIAAGKAYCWGRNTYGNLGDGTTTDQWVAVPVKADGVLSGKTLVDISGAGHGYSCVLDTAAEPYCWGENEHGQLGDGTTSNSSVPVAVIPGVLAGKQLRRIADQYDHTCVLDATGSAYCWGHEDQGGLGNGAAADINVMAPTAVNQTVPFTDLSPGEHLTCAIGTDRRAYCWGDNDTGGVGDNTNTDRSTPVPVYTAGALSSKQIVAVSAGTGRACALDSAGLAYCWGDNIDGALGDGSTTSATTPQPVLTTGVLAGKHLVRIETDEHHTCALDTAGAAYCWGLGGDGQLGDDTTTDSTAPVAVDFSALPAGTSFADIRLGYRHTCAQTSNGRTYCWGSNNHGQLGDGTATSRSRPAESVHNMPVLPSTPTGLSVQRPGTWADVTWNPSTDVGAPALIGYVVTAMPGHHTCQSATTSCRVTGLSTSTTYTFTVAAWSVLGSVQASSLSAGSGSVTTVVASQTLPATGGPTTQLALAGLALAGLGGVAVLAARRRRPRETGGCA